jgi:Protein of unknown function (DUF3761)
MRAILVSAFLGLAMTVSTSTKAQAPTGSTGECKDGTYTSAESKKGACGGHGGVKEWFGSSSPSKASAPATAAAAKTPAPAMAAAAPAPSGSTGQCKDGTYTSTETKKGACGGHGGVKDWYGSATPAKTSAASAAAAPPAAKASAAPMVPAAPAPAAKTSTSPMAAAPAAGGGPGQVWVNTKSKVYHCPGTEWYGKTKAGEYMTESAAKAAGNHADHGKACS